MSYCPTGKISHPTAAAASRVHAAQAKRHGKEKGRTWHPGPSMVYRCHCCHGWHIGHTTKAVKNRRPRDLDWSFA